VDGDESVPAHQERSLAGEGGPASGIRSHGRDAVAADRDEAVRLRRPIHEVRVNRPREPTAARERRHLDVPPEPQHGPADDVERARVADGDCDLRPVVHDLGHATRARADGIVPGDAVAEPVRERAPARVERDDASLTEAAAHEEPHRA
jgi:hypothetical protein